MGETTAISWCDSTINAWHGCTKVDALCRNCYAEVSTPVRVKRAGGLEVWGSTAARSETKSWERDLRRWNREALATGITRRVFGQSLSDTFEDYGGGHVIYAAPHDHAALEDVGLDTLRARFLSVVEQCTSLTFQLLTKRPENVLRMVPPAWLKSWPGHVWIGTSVGDQDSADRRIPHLVRIPAPVRFLSVEPQLGPVNLRECAHVDDYWIDALDTPDPSCRISWVIQGGESGPRARPFDLDWARDLRDQCRAAGVPWFFKQAGAVPIFSEEDVRALRPRAHRLTFAGVEVRLNDSHGSDLTELPCDLHIREFPHVAE